MKSPFNPVRERKWKWPFARTWLRVSRHWHDLWQGHTIKLIKTSFILQRNQIISTQNNEVPPHYHHYPCCCDQHRHRHKCSPQELARSLSLLCELWEWTKRSLWRLGAFRAFWPFRVIRWCQAPSLLCELGRGSWRARVWLSVISQERVEIDFLFLERLWDGEKTK